MMKGLGIMHYFLGLDIWKRSDDLFISQGKYTMEIMWRFGMVDFKSINTPMDSNLRKIHETKIGVDPMDATLYK